MSSGSRPWWVRPLTAAMRKTARGIDRTRMVPIRLGSALDALDRRIGNAAWWLRFKADRLRAGEVDDGIPF